VTEPSGEEIPAVATLRPGQVARIFGVTTPTILRWARKGRLTRLPGGVYNKAEVERLAIEHQILPDPKGARVDTRAEVIYPQHEKVARHQDATQSAGEFLDWLIHEKDIRLVVFDNRNRPLVISQTTQDLLAEWVGVDLDALNAEKEAMLDRIREENS